MKRSSIVGLCSVLAFGGCSSEEARSPFERRSQTLDTTSAAVGMEHAIVVRVYVHVVHDGSNDVVEEEAIHEQIAVLNSAFSGEAGGHNTVFRFTLDPKDIEHVVNPAWFELLPGSEAEREAKGALHRGGATDLNIYVANTGDPHSDSATSPAAASQDPALDGIVILSGSLPGGSAKPYNEGDIAVHQVGHWLGLLHTFADGCTGGDNSAKQGDLVKDTPRQAKPTLGCPVPGSADSCPSPSGPDRSDPWQNFMDFTDDACMWELTRGQALRMNQAWKLRSQGPEQSCGDGLIQDGETCDIAITAGTSGACPSAADCDDGIACTSDTIVGVGCMAQCEHVAIASPDPVADGCCPASGDANNDPDCSETCGDGQLQDGETCDTAIAAGAPGACPTSGDCKDEIACTRDTLVNAGSCTAKCDHVEISSPDPVEDGCCPASGDPNNDADCKAVNAAFRFSALTLVDPHIFQDTSLGCVDGTDSVNAALAKNLNSDADGDGAYDLSPVIVFSPLDPSASKSNAILDMASCLVDSQTCKAGLSPGPVVAQNVEAGGSCLAVLPGTTNPSYGSANEPSGPCFMTAPTTITITVQGANLTLYDASIGTQYSGDPVSSLTEGVLRGFVTEEDANNTVLPDPVSAKLSSVLAGGEGNCKEPAPAVGDKDSNEGRPGWYFYLNYSAIRALYAN